jgi:hypothetical protein
VQVLKRILTATLLALPLAATAATPITGTVINKTTGKPSAGDEIVLIRLAQGMQETTHATTDARGRYKIEVPDDGLHLVRVTHDNANYFKPAPAGTTTVDLEVYSGSDHVKEIAVGGMVLRAQTDPSGNTLKIVENLFVENTSQPQVTLSSKEPFDIYLPENAVIEGSAAMAPNGMPVQAAPVPLSEKGKYTFNFPIRPGETRFQVSYHIPYPGKLELNPRPTLPTDTLAIILPKAISFKPSAGAPYSAVDEEAGAQTYVARSVTPGQATSFQLSGTGELPRDTSTAGAADGQQTTAGGGGPVAATNNTAPGKGLDNPLDPDGTREPITTKYKYWILAGLILMLAAGAGLLLRKPTSNLAAQPPSQPQQLLQTIKDELFALETDRLQNKISDTDYAAQKTALETVLRRALSRNDNA